MGIDYNSCGFSLCIPRFVIFITICFFSRPTTCGTTSARQCQVAFFSFFFLLFFWFYLLVHMIVVVRSEENENIINQSDSWKGYSIRWRSRFSGLLRVELDTVSVFSFRFIPHLVHSVAAAFSVVTFMPLDIETSI